MKYKDDKIQESIVVDHIDEALKAYLTKKAFKYSSMRPANRSQAFEDLDSYCGDLVTAWGSYRALVLEVKFAGPRAVSSWDEDQNEGLQELESRGVPIYVSYNLLEVDKLTEVAAERLPEFACVRPSMQTSSKILTDVNLKTIVDALINGKPKKGDEIDLPLSLATFVNTEIASSRTEIQRLSTKALLFLYDSSLDALTVLDRELVSKILQKMLDKSFKAKSKERIKMAEAIEEMAAALNDEIEMELGDKPKNSPSF